MFKTLFMIILIIFIIFLCVITAGGAAGAFAIACAEFLSTAGFPMLASFVTSIAAMGIPWYVAAAVGLGLGYLVWPEATSEMIGAIGDVASKVGSEIADVVGGTASTLLGSFLTGPGGLLLLGGLALWFFTRSGDRSPGVSATTEPNNEAPQSLDPLTGPAAAGAQSGSLV